MIRISGLYVFVYIDIIHAMYVRTQCLLCAFMHATCYVHRDACASRSTILWCLCKYRLYRRVQVQIVQGLVAEVCIRMNSVGLCTYRLHICCASFLFLHSQFVTGSWIYTYSWSNLPQLAYSTYRSIRIARIDCMSLCKCTYCRYVLVQIASVSLSLGCTCMHALGFDRFV